MTTPVSPLAVDDPVADGRYRLRERCGADIVIGVEFWYAQDELLRRPVASTVLTGDSADPATRDAADTPCTRPGS